MNRLSIRILTITLSCRALTAYFSAIPHDITADELKIGIVDMNGIFEKYDKRSDLDEKLKKMERKAMKAMTRMVLVRRWRKRVRKIQVMKTPKMVMLLTNLPSILNYQV